MTTLGISTPTRSLKESAEEPVPQDLWQFAFSSGRRSCAGYKFAQREMFLGVARLLCCFEILPRGVLDQRKVKEFGVDEAFPMEVIVRSAAR